MRQLREFVNLYRLLRGGGNTVRFSVRNAWVLVRHSMRVGG
jgi:hypothetical protein